MWTGSAFSIFPGRAIEVTNDTFFLGRIKIISFVALETRLKIHAGYFTVEIIELLTFSKLIKEIAFRTFNTDVFDIIKLVTIV